MQFIVSKAFISSALKNVHVAFNAKAAVPILSCVKMETKDGHLHLTANNTESEAVDVVECNVIEDGAVAVPMDTLMQIIDQLESDKMVTFKVVGGSPSGKNLIIECQEDSYNINYQQVEEFPPCFPELYDDGIKIKGKDLKQLLDRTSFAMSKSQDRYNLNGLFLTTSVPQEQEDGNSYLCSIATDGHRLAFAKTQIEEKEIKIKGVVVPSKAVNNMSGLINDESDCILIISQEKGRISLTINRLRFSAKLLDVHFPDWQKVVPSENKRDKILEVDKVIFASKMNAAATTAKGKGVCCILKPEVVELIGRGPSGETSNIVLKGHSFVGADEFKTTYNPIFIVDALKKLDKKARMCFSEPASQVLIQSVEDSSFFYVVMPMKTED